VLVVWYSMTGGSRQMAQAAADAIAAQDVDARQMPAAEAGADDVLSADGLLVVTPENLGTMSGVMKDFFDRTYYPVLDRVAGRPYAALVCAGSDGHGAARQIQRIATGWRLREVAPPLIVCTHAQTPERILAQKRIGEADRARCAEVGALLAAGLAAGVF
jgi:NAD(P)H-dependent FMN reductase